MKTLKLSKKLIVTTIIVLILAAGGVIWFLNEEDTTPKSTITEGTAVKGNIDVFIEGDGVVSVEKANVNFSQTGTLKEIIVKVGDKVAVGDVLATIESGKLQYQVDQAKATYNANIAKADRLKPVTGEEIIVKESLVNAAKLALVAETNIYNDVVVKYTIGSAQELAENAKLRKAESDVSSAEAQLALTAATYKDAQYAISLSLANLDSAKLALSEATLKSPMAGTVASISGIVGQSTGGTQQTTSSLIVISKLDNLAIISNLDEEDISKIKVGQKIEAEFPSLGKTVTGSVTYVSQVAKTDSNGSVTYEVRMDFVDKDMSIIDGMNASIKFITKSVEGVVRVPNKAVKMVSGKSTVSYYDAAKNILTKEVTTGFTDGLNVEIVTGLLAGDKYVIVEIK